MIVLGHHASHLPDKSSQPGQVGRLEPGEGDGDAEHGGGADRVDQVRHLPPCPETEKQEAGADDGGGQTREVVKARSREGINHIHNLQSSFIHVSPGMFLPVLVWEPSVSKCSPRLPISG